MSSHLGAIDGFDECNLWPPAGILDSFVDITVAYELMASPAKIATLQVVPMHIHGANAYRSDGPLDLLLEDLDLLLALGLGLFAGFSASMLAMVPLGASRLGCRNGGRGTGLRRCILRRNRRLLRLWRFLDQDRRLFYRLRTLHKHRWLLRCGWRLHQDLRLLWLWRSLHELCEIGLRWQLRLRSRLVLLISV